MIKFTCTSTVLFASLLPIGTHADNPTPPAQFADVRGTIEMTTVDGANSLAKALHPRTEKICDVAMKIPIHGGFEGDLGKGVECVTKLKGKSAKILVMGHVYTAPARKSEKDVVKHADVLLKVDSAALKFSDTLFAGTYASNLQEHELHLSLSTPDYTSGRTTKKTESISVSLTFTDTKN